MTNKPIERELLGARLRDARVKAGITQEEAAKKAEIAQSQLSMIESGKRRVPAETAAKLFALYGVEYSCAEAEAETGKENTDALTLRKSEDMLKLIFSLAEKSGSARFTNAIDEYLNLCAYLFLRRLYLVNPHNSEKVFSLNEKAAKTLSDYLADEPEKLMSFATHSKEVRNVLIEPDEEGIEEFIRMIRECEKKAAAITGCKLKF
ncbi:MAG: helix-turn-helix domain-containing protein [Oscillospiraceae bacterium]